MNEENRFEEWKEEEELHSLVEKEEEVELKKKKEKDKEEDEER